MERVNKPKHTNVKCAKCNKVLSDFEVFYAKNIQETKICARCELRAKVDSAKGVI